MNLEASSHGSGLNLVLNRDKWKDKQSPVHGRHPQEGHDPPLTPLPRESKLPRLPRTPPPGARIHHGGGLQAVNPVLRDSPTFPPALRSHRVPEALPPPNPTLQDSTHRTAAPSPCCSCARRPRGQAPGRSRSAPAVHHRKTPPAPRPSPPQGSDLPGLSRPRPSARGSHDPPPVCAR